MLRLNTTIKSIEANESGELVIKGNASTPSTDRARDVILLDAWAKGGIDNYRKNPILLFNHNYDEPIGKVTEMNLTDRGLEVEGVVFEGSKAFPLIKNGVLKTFSVGFLIKDADYNKATDGLIIKDAELLEISVVSVPCNQEATFEVSKSYTDEEFENLKTKFGKQAEVKELPEITAEQLEEIKEKFGLKSDKGAQTPELNKMDEDQVNELIAKSVADALAKAEADREAKAKAAEEAKKKAEEEETRIAATVTKTVAEKVEEAVKSALEGHKPDEALAKTVAELESTIKENAVEIKALSESRGGFFPDRGSARKDWTGDRDLANKAVEAFILSKATKKDILSSDYAQEVVKAVNTQSSVQVSSETFEQEVTNIIERDIQQDLVLAPLFREVQLKSASQLLTIAPDVGYATHQTTGSTLPGTKPNGLLNNADGSQPYVLEEISFRTDKLVSKAYLANDTDEDTLVPLLGFIRDAMVRQHAKSVDRMILDAGVVGGTYPNMVSKGLLAYATTASGRRIDGPAATGDLTGANLLAARAGMRKYGLSPNDVVYIVSTDSYFQLLKDEAFYDASALGQQGTLATGEVGRMFGSRILVSAELDATPAAGTVAALAVNVRNFVVPRLRGYTFETEYSVDGQHQLLATTQRLGFTEVIPDAKSVVAIAYTA